MLKIKAFTLFLMLIVAAGGMLVGCKPEARPQDTYPGPGKNRPPEMQRQAGEFERRMSDHRGQVEHERMELDRMRDEMRGQVKREREEIERARRALEERQQEMKKTTFRT